MEKPKIFNTENTSKYLEYLTNNKITVKEYRKNATSILYCNDCNNEFKYRFCDFVRKTKNNEIPHKCKSKNKKITKEIFEIKLKEQEDLLENEYSFLENFIDYNTKILCRHNICGHEWKVAPRHFVGYMQTRCPYCFNKNSKYEKLINKYLKENNFNFIRNYNNKELGRKSFDFAILNENNIEYLIEFDGEQHDKIKFHMTEADLLKQKENDKLKNEFAEKYNIPLLRIKYKERKNWKSILENFLNENK